MSPPSGKGRGGGPKKGEGRLVTTLFVFLADNTIFIGKSASQSFIVRRAGGRPARPRGGRPRGRSGSATPGRPPFKRRRADLLIEDSGHVGVPPLHDLRM